MIRRLGPLVNYGERIVCLKGMKLHTNASKVLYSRFNKDLPIPTVPTPLSKAISNDTDILLEQIQKAKSPNRIFELISQHLDVMNAKHIVASLRSIRSLAQNNEESDHLMGNSTFQGLCSQLMRCLRLMEPQDLIIIYKSLSGLGVQNNTYVMQAVLKMIGGHLNDMNLGQLTFLSFLLSKQRHNPLVDGLRLALPLVLQVQIEQQLDSDNLTEVVDCLQLAARSKLKPSTIQKVLSVVLKKAKSLSPSNATTVVFALLSLETPLDGYKELLNYALNIIVKNMELMDSKKIITIVRTCSIQNSYHSPFCFTVADKVVSEKWNLENTWEVMKCLKRLGFSPPNLLDYLVNVIQSESDSLRTNNSYSILQCAEMLSATGHHPPDVNKVLEILCSCTDKLEGLKERSPHLLMKFLSCLSMLGYFPEFWLKQALNEEFLLSTWSKSRKLARGLDFEKSLFTFVWSSVVYDRQQDFPIPSSLFKNLLNNTFERYCDHTCPLQSFIENGLGGSQFLKSCVFTQDGIVVDHVVAMRSGNYPVNLDSSVHNKSPQTFMYLEDMVLPADAKIVAVIVAYEDKYCRDPEVLKGFMDIKVKCLAKKNFSPVVINYVVWRDLPDREKIPYLMKEIKSAIHEDSIASTNPIS